MRFQPRHVVTMVVAVCAAAVLAPVGVMAATGTLVNIVDPVLGDRKVRVGSAGSLQVESRPGVTSGGFNWTGNTSGYSTMKVREVVGPARIALTELTATSDGGAVGGWNVVSIAAYVQTTGPATCPGSYGYTKTVLRTVQARNHESTLQLDFVGPPLIVPAAPAGKKVCVTAEVISYSPDSAIYLGATGFTYS